MDIAPLMPAHRPQAFYMFSAEATEHPLPASACARRQNVLHNKAGKSQAQQI